MRLIRSIKGGVLMLQNVQKLDINGVLHNKRVAIIGGADSAFSEPNGDYINKFDIVIRINRAIHTWNIEKSKFIGSKTDILFHNFFENNDSGGGGPLDILLYNKMGVNYLINPRNDFDAYRRTFNFYKKYNKSYRTYHLSNKHCAQRDRSFGNVLKPTIGFSGLYSALNSECKELYITGFTFWKTPYAKGYRDHVIDLEENKKHFKKQGVHDADLEYQLFKNELKTSLCKSIVLDEKLTEIINSENND
ncbi:glycosyltransferase family 29 protein [Christiangramia sediminis]|uniref:Glycosyltransferase family 29 protein n=1 Tax=Christiangramia sediminis TaxID=2881336 RepID=A0A9X1LHW2_9FLAO|nr:glycosyltransferase family 29 protein [Christiangramia sediminis]MCB7480615.1 glycosyltransferase family 29 protein [Christiangramia sediminis]